MICCWREIQLTSLSGRNFCKPLIMLRKTTRPIEIFCFNIAKIATFDASEMGKTQGYNITFKQMSGDSCQKTQAQTSGGHWKKFCCANFLTAVAAKKFQK